MEFVDVTEKDGLGEAVGVDIILDPADVLTVMPKGGRGNFAEGLFVDETATKVISN